MRVVVFQQVNPHPEEPRACAASRRMGKEFPLISQGASLAMKLVSTPDNPAPDRAVTGTVTTPDGVELRFARWGSPADAKGTVCVFSGRGEFIEKYFETVRDLRRRGFAVATMDWRGQ